MLYLYSFLSFVLMVWVRYEEQNNRNLKGVEMYAVEFETTIKDGIVQIPKEYKSIYNQEKAQVFIISADKPRSISVEKEDDFLAILKNGPTISKKETEVWENDIKQGYGSWKIEEF